MKCFIYCRKSQEAEDRQVMSLQSQQDEIERLIAADPNITVVDAYCEAFSAKQPGRPLFDEMVRRIEAGEAECIIAWHPDRLARNSMDGGRVIFLLDQKKLKDLRFCSYSFENSSQGKFMLAIMFSQSKYYVDELSETVKRGLRTKLKNGWRPNGAPIGYSNCPQTKTVIPDKEHFEAVRGMFELLLSGHHTAAQVHRIICNDWGYTTPVRKTQGGKKPALSTVYKILGNPFYAGYIKWNGDIFPGKHEPVVTKSEFEEAQRLLGRAGSPRPKNLSFAYAGLFKCGACGLSVTAEKKRKPSGREYIYYHCTRVHRTPKCTQRSIEEKQLEEQILKFIDSITLPQSIYDWLVSVLEIHADEFAANDAQRAENHALEAKKLEKQISNLTDLRIREMVTEDEFTDKRKILQTELDAVREKIANEAKKPPTFEPARSVGLLCVRAKKWFPTADDEAKRKLLQIMCSNPILRDRKALLVPKKPFLM